MTALAPLLKKPDLWKLHFKLLRKEDVQPLPQGYAIGEGSVTLLWIWMEMGADPEDKDSVNDGRPMERLHQCLICFYRTTTTVAMSASQISSLARGGTSDI